MPEYNISRCCMCPNIGKELSVYPGIIGTPHPEPSSCRLVKSYIDERGWKYKVTSGLGENSFKARYQKPEKKGSDGWHCLRSLPWRDTFDSAQGDLNIYADLKGWAECE